MKDFIPTLNQNFTFGNCKNCQAHCCSGLHGSIYSQILKEEFEAVYKNFPILFTQLSHIVNHKFLYKKASLNPINRHFLI